MPKPIYPRSMTILAVVAVFCIFLTSTLPVAAVSTDTLNVSTSCPLTQKVTYSGSLSVDTDRYDVYARLPREGQTASVSVYSQANLSADCSLVGTANVSGDSWTKVGSVSDLESDTPALFQLSSDELGSTLDANRPSVMLVSQTEPPCVPTVECYVSIGNATGYVRPPGTLPNEDSLHIVRVINPSKDTLLSVTYYVENQAAYSKPTLEPFDLRYASQPSQSLAKVLHYQSGQLVVIQSQTPDTFVPSFGDVLFRLFLSHASLTWIYIIGIVVTILAIIGAAIVHTYHDHHRFLYRYRSMRRYQQYLTLPDDQKKRYDMRQTRLRLVRLGFVLVAGAGTAFLLIVSLNTFVATIYKVDGHSMESTLFTGNEEFVNKLPVTLADLAGSRFIPARGSIVILHASYGIGESESFTAPPDIIKRVIGLPGERVVVHNGSITVYNSDNPNGFDPDQGSSWQTTMHPNDPSENIDVTLKENELFISGDNRPVSIDSRFNGPITTDQVVGVVEFTLF